MIVFLGLADQGDTRDYYRLLLIGHAGVVARTFLALVVERSSCWARAFVATLLARLKRGRGGHMRSIKRRVASSLGGSKKILLPPVCAPAAADAAPALAHQSTFNSGSTTATKISSLWRGHLIRDAIKDQLQSVVAKPSIKASKAAQTASLPHNERGELLPIFCSVECFKVFGAGVYAYMRWQQYMALVFAIAFALACPNMLYNALGDALPQIAGDSSAWLTITTLGNVARVNVSYGVVELFICLTFVAALFHGRQMLTTAEAQVREEEERGGSPESTVWLHNLPADTKAAELKERLQRMFGDCRHVVLAYANRALLLRMSKRTPLIEDLYYRQALLYLTRHAKRPNKAAIEKHFAKLEQARTNLQAHDKETARLASQRYDCTGDAFVTFASAAEANACIAHFGRRTKLGHLAEQLLATPLHETATGARHLTSAVRHVALLSPTRAHGATVQVAPHVDDALTALPAPAALDLPDLPAGVCAELAPAPSDILWEGLSTSERERFWRQVVSTALTMGIACLGTFIITWVTLQRDGGDGQLRAHLLEGLFVAPSGFLGIIINLVMSLVTALPCIFGNVILFATTPLFADVIERHATFSDKESTIVVKVGTAHSPKHPAHSPQPKAPSRRRRHSDSPKPTAHSPEHPAHSPQPTALASAAARLTLHVLRASLPPSHSLHPSPSPSLPLPPSPSLPLPPSLSLLSPLSRRRRKLKY